MDLNDIISNRRSIRAYKSQELPEETINQLIDAARKAPSAGNVQPWAFVVVSKQETKEELSRAAYGQRWLEGASVVIVVCVDEQRAEESYGERGKVLYCIQDTAAAIQNMLLSACALGLGTCWVGAFKEGEIRRIISSPPEMRPIALISVGYPAESPKVRTRRSIHEIVFKDTF